ncbi:hypothetical protein GCM10010402_48930 [Actinomadura luteofluorescens]
MRIGGDEQLPASHADARERARFTWDRRALSDLLSKAVRDRREGAPRHAGFRRTLPGFGKRVGVRWWSPDDGAERWPRHGLAWMNATTVRRRVEGLGFRTGGGAYGGERRFIELTWGVCGGAPSVRGAGRRAGERARDVPGGRRSPGVGNDRHVIG